MRVLAIGLLVAVMVGLAGCNTARGFGKDVERLGQVIQGKPAETETVQPVNAPVLEAPSQSMPVQPEVEVYPYQGGSAYPATPSQPTSTVDPSLGEVVPSSSIKKM